MTVDRTQPPGRSRVLALLAAYEENMIATHGENWRDTQRKRNETAQKIAATKAYKRQWGVPGYICIVRWQSDDGAYYNVHLEDELGGLSNQGYEVVRRIWYGRTDKSHRAIAQRLSRFELSSDQLGYHLPKSALYYIVDLTEDQRPPDYKKPLPVVTETADERKPFSTKGYVYVLKAPMTPGNWYKIGRTRNPVNRLATFNVKLPFPVEYEHLIKTDDMYTLEAELHRRYQHKRGDGEWFALTEQDVIDIISTNA